MIELWGLSHQLVAAFDMSAALGLPTEPLSIDSQSHSPGAINLLTHLQSGSSSLAVRAAVPFAVFGRSSFRIRCQKPHRQLEVGERDLTVRQPPVGENHRRQRSQSLL